jgi:hypothetical protein
MHSHTHTHPSCRLDLLLFRKTYNIFSPPVLLSSQHTHTNKYTHTSTQTLSHLHILTHTLLQTHTHIACCAGVNNGKGGGGEPVCLKTEGVFSEAATGNGVALSNANPCPWIGEKLRGKKKKEEEEEEKKER